MRKETKRKPAGKKTAKRESRRTGKVRATAGSGGSPNDPVGPGGSSNDPVGPDATG